MRDVSEANVLNALKDFQKITSNKFIIVNKKW